MTTPATPSPTTATPVTTPFWTYVKSEIPNHLKVIGICAAIALAIIGYNYVKDLRAQLAQKTAQVDTLAQPFQAKGNSAISSSTVGTQQQLQAQAVAAYDPTLISQMRSQGDTIAKLTSLVATMAGNRGIPATTTGYTSQNSVVTATTSPALALTGYTLEQTRPNGPALTAASIYYDPTAKDAATAFKGTTWDNYTEQFNASVASWSRKKDGSLASTVSLSRTVTHPDPNDPTKTVTVGTEKIPITGSNTIYVPSDFTAPLVLPRWTASIGVSGQPGSNNGYQPTALLDYRVTNKFGAFAGTANRGITAGVSIRLGSK
jgi:hypothetical protein